MRLVVSHDGRIVQDVRTEKDSVRIGRFVSCDVVLSGKGMARFHAIVEKTSDGFSVVDMGSPAGTYVGGEKILRRVVDLGQPIEIGPYRITVEPEVVEPEEILEAQILEEEIESPPADPDPHDMVLIPVNGDLVAAPVAKVLWSATPEEMAAEPRTGEVDIHQALETALAEVTPIPLTRVKATAPVTNETVIPLELRRG